MSKFISLTIVFSLCLSSVNAYAYTPHIDLQKSSVPHPHEFGWDRTFLDEYLNDIQQQNGTQYTFENCDRVDKESVRDEIEQRALEVLINDESDLDIEAVVQRKWIELDMDTVLDGEVDKAAEEIRVEVGYLSSLWSGWSAERAEELASRVAAESFGSEVFRAKITELSIAVGLEIAKEIEAKFAQASSAAFHCMKDYVGDQYSETLFQTFQEKVSLEVDENAELTFDERVDISALDVHGKALGGVGIIIATEIARRVATKLGKKIADRIAGKIVGRIVGRVGSSFIPVAGWAVGAGLIIWDLVEGGKGAFPQIQSALKDEEIKQKIRDEITDAIEVGLPEEVSIVALEISVTLLEEWGNFCDDYRYVCIVAEENERFKRLLDDTPVSQIGELSSLVDVFMSDLGRDDLDQALENGYFEKFIEAPQILQETRSTEQTLAWLDLAGDLTPKVVELELHRNEQLTANDLDRASLEAIIGLDSKETIDKLLQLDSTQVQTLLTISPSELKSIVDTYPVNDLSWFSDYLAGSNATAESASITKEEAIAALAYGGITIDELRARFEGTNTGSDEANAPGLSGLLAGNEEVIALGILGIAALALVFWGGTAWGRRKDLPQQAKKPETQKKSVETVQNGKKKEPPKQPKNKEAALYELKSVDIEKSAHRIVPKKSNSKSRK